MAKEDKPLLETALIALEFLQNVIHLNNWAYFSDKEDERQAVLEALRKLYVLSRTNIIVFPYYGIGTGLAMMQEKSPKLFEEMNGILKEFFGFDNVTII